MIELLVSAIVALTTALLALFRLAVGLFALLLGAIELGVEYLATKPKEGESRLSLQRIVVATIPVVMVCLLIAMLWGVFRWRLQAPGPHPRAAPAAVQEDPVIVQGFRDTVQQAVRDKAKRTVEDRLLKRSRSSEPE